MLVATGSDLDVLDRKTFFRKFQLEPPRKNFRLWDHNYLVRPCSGDYSIFILTLELRMLQERGEEIQGYPPRQEKCRNAEIVINLWISIDPILVTFDGFFSDVMSGVRLRFNVVADPPEPIMPRIII